MTASPPPFDVIVAADPRLSGAAGRSLAAALGALANAGYATALIALLGAARDPRSGFGGEVRHLLDTGRVALADPDLRLSCRLLLGYHVLPFAGVLAAPLRLDAERRVLRFDQLLADLEGRPLFDLAGWLREIDEGLAGPVELAPVDPGVAAALAGSPLAARSAAAMPPVVAAARYRNTRAVPPDRLVLVGDGWHQEPAALLAARADLRAASVEAVLASGEGEPVDGAWVRPPPGLGGVLQPDLAEALASGLPVVGPPSCRPALEGALIEIPDDGARSIRALPEPGWQEAAQASARLASSLTPERFIERVRALIGIPKERPPRVPLRRDLRPQQAVVLMSSNGVGVGHLIRGMAIARRLPASVRPVFFTLSGAAHTAARQGWHVESFQHVQHYDGDPQAWRAALASRLDDLLAFHRARVFVFDGNVPYAALFDLKTAHPEVWFVWVRRGMWRSTHDHVGRLPHPFDLVIAPGELAGDYDAGVTSQTEDALPVPPITFFDREELSARTEARLELALDDATVAVLLQLGAGNNFDMSAVRADLIEHLAGRPGIRMFEGLWPMSFRAQPDPRVVRLERFPVADLLPGFDLVVSACGYNSFHEIVQAGVPAVYVPNENPEMDAQEQRALWAMRQGLAEMGSALQPFRTVRAVERLLDRDERTARLARLARLDHPNGAARAAELIADLASGLRSLEPGTGITRRAAAPASRGPARGQH